MCSQTQMVTIDSGRGQQHGRGRDPLRHAVQVGEEIGVDARRHGGRHHGRAQLVGVKAEDEAAQSAR